MRRFLTAALSLFTLPAVPLLTASVCSDHARADAHRVSDMRVDHYITDATLHRRWAIAVDCRHPDHPWTLQAAPWADGAPAPRIRSSQAETLVRAGAKVSLWRMDGAASINLSGTALESGANGQMIHVRTGQHGAVLEGKVRGAGSVELLIPNRWQSQTGRGSGQ